MPEKQAGGDAATGGRPRDSARGAAILEAALDLLSEVGYDRLSVEAVAARSGVAKTTIYRRWADKASLVAAALAARAVRPSTAAATGDLRSTAVAVIRNLAQQMGEQDLGLLTAMFAARRTDPALAEALHLILKQDEVAMTAPLLLAAHRSGEALRPDVAHVFAELVPAFLLHRLLVLGEEPGAAVIDHLVDRILLPLIVER